MVIFSISNKNKGFCVLETGPTILALCVKPLEAEVASAHYRWPSEEKASSPGSLVENLSVVRLQRG